MESFSVAWRQTAKKDLRRLPQQEAGRVMQAVGRLADNPRPKGSQKLQGSEHTYRIRVGVYRVIYDVLSQVRVVAIQRVGHRKDVYRE
jgi:mRNA interferase RelE/StbE